MRGCMLYNIIYIYIYMSLSLLSSPPSRSVYIHIYMYIYGQPYIVALPAGEILQWVASLGNRLIDSKPWVSILG